MIVDLECGCRIDDALKSTVHEADGRHYPLGTSPESYCPKCDLFRPCLCDAAAGSGTMADIERVRNTADAVRAARRTA